MAKEVVGVFLSDCSFLHGQSMDVVGGRDNEHASRPFGASSAGNINKSLRVDSCHKEGKRPSRSWGKKANFRSSCPS